MNPPAEPPPTTSLHFGATYDTEEGTAAGIYGIIVCTAVMAASHAATAPAAIAAVIVTLIIYWAAERYSRIVAERIHAGHRPTRHTIRVQLTTGWEMITASAIPLLVLVIVRLLGASLYAALVSAMACSTVLLCGAGWRMGRQGGLPIWERIASAAVAGLFGVALIILKTVLH